MAKNIKALLEETEKLKKKNKELQQQLREARGSIHAIKTGNIDALVITDENAIKVFTEETADKTYRILIEKMNEGAVTLNKNGTILFSNSSFANMVNLPLQKVIGTKFQNFIDDSSTKRFEDILKHGGEYAIKEEIYIYTYDGKAIAVLMSVTAFSLDNNFILNIILTDLTIQNKNQEELKQRTSQLEQKNIELESANKDLTSFTYLSSHDLQEPLRKIQNFVSFILLEEVNNLSETGKGYFERMKQIAKRMQTLIDDLLVYSRTKNSERKFEKTDLNLILDEVKKDYEEEIRNKNATIEISNLCDVNIIRFQFRQLMHNLIGNSLKFSKPQTALHIVIKSEVVKGSKLDSKNLALPTGQVDLPAGKLSPNIDYCHIIYTDNGIGFEPHFADRIFEVFQRLHSQEKYKGTGMGLAICKRIIENHNGIITATGKINKFARFDIYIPVS